MKDFFLFLKKDILPQLSYQLSGFYGPLLKHLFRIILPVKNNLKKSLQCLFYALINLIIF